MKVKFEDVRLKLDDIERAYKKLKNYVYYDNTTLFLREKLAEFESSNQFEQNISDLFNFIDSNKSVENSRYFNNLCNDIGFNLYIKKIKSEEECVKDNIISNRMIYDKYEVQKLTYLIDAPIEIHIISALWVMNVGKILESEYKSYCYANIIGVKKSSSIFIKPYFKLYSEWRDNAIKKAKKALEDNNDILILSLDIKEYYNSVQFNFDKLVSYLKTKENEIDNLGLCIYLTDLLKIIYQKYHLILKNEKKENDFILPIGILSSGILANWYLKDFDTNVNNKIKPLYYGRYVDDIIIVLINPIITKSEGNSLSNNILFKYFIGNEILIRNISKDKLNNNIESNNCSYIYNLKDFKNLEIQSDKIIIYNLTKNNSTAVIDKFERKIIENSSEFRFLPEDEELKKEFIDEANHVYYSDSINKLRSVENFNHDKYGASKFLAKLIYTNLLSDFKTEDKTINQILKFFRGKVNLDFYTLLEKLFTFFVVSKLEKERNKLLNDIFSSISRLEFDTAYFENIINPLKDKEQLKEKLTKDLIHYLYIALNLSFSLEPKSCNGAFIKNFDRKLQKYKDRLKFKVDFDNTIKNFRTSNLVRHNYMFYPLINYTSLYDSDFSYIDRKNLDISEYNKIFEIDPKSNMVKYTPRNISFYECCVFSIYQDLIQRSKDNTLFNSSDYINKARDLYFSINKTNLDLLIENNNDNIPDFMKDKIKLENPNDNISYHKIFINEEIDNDSKLKIGIANTKILSSNVQKNLEDKPNLSRERKNEIFQLLNSVIKDKVKLFVLPEFYIPFNWLDFIATFSKRHELAIVTGLEHFIHNGIAFNFIATILPFKYNNFNDAIIILRLKNHYAPFEESIIINEKQLKIPNKENKIIYDLFHWSNASFSVFYCYELANINHRGLFKSKVDFLIASEYNKDINYFSNIVESVVRDIHCYFIQVNSSDYGDSRITQPSKTEIMNLVRTKGGYNNTFLSEYLDIHKLRKFQKMTICGQNNSKMDFKNTPPNFDSSEVDKR